MTDLQVAFVLVAAVVIGAAYLWLCDRVRG
jgi:hypothetical protein